MKIKLWFIINILHLAVFTEFLVTSNYTSQKRGELTLKKGDGIRQMQVLEKGWYYGTIVGRTGLFPAKCVTITNTTPSAPTEKVIIEINSAKEDSSSSEIVELPLNPEELLCPICMELPSGNI